MLSLNLNKFEKPFFDCYVIFREQKGSWFLTRLPNLFLVSKEKRPKNGSTFNKDFLSAV